MENSAIQWCHHTFNPWRGCTKVSPGCEHCYAEALSKRFAGKLGRWGPNGSRVLASTWRDPFRWNRKAIEAIERHRVFCASLADVFEAWNGPITDIDGLALTMLDGSPMTLDDVRVDLWQVIQSTPSLDWLLLTKRPENVLDTLRAIHRVEGDNLLDDSILADWFNGVRPPHNVWLGTSVEDREFGLPRIDVLRQLPAVVRFLSVEPLLEDLGEVDLTGIHWVIVGGESGPKARPFDLRWVGNVLRQCREQQVAVFVKQLGRRPSYDGHAMTLNDAHGGDWDEWPDYWKVREFPRG